MNIKRGLLRTWIVASALWIVSVGSVFAPLALSTFNASDSENHPALARNDYEAPTLTPPPSGGTFAEKIRRRRLQIDADGREPADLATPAKPLYVATVGLMTAFLPPVFVLILGSSFYWAVSGFRQD